MTVSVFISQPMRGKSDDEILDERKELEKLVAELHQNAKTEVIDSFIKNAPIDASSLWYLGESIKLLSTADVAVFGKGWREARGCCIEHICAKEYGVKIIEED